MFATLKNWRRQRVLRTAEIPEPLWREALELLPFLAICTDEEFLRLRAKVILFLYAKSIVGARGHRVTPLQRVVIATQACILVLNLDMRYYDGWENIIVYPDEFVPGWEWEDDAGVVHTNDAPMAGEAMPGGPVVLSWPDVLASTDWDAAGMNLAIHEFAHKLDMRNGAANGCPPLPSTMSPKVWKDTLDKAYRHFYTARRARRPHGDRPVRRRVGRRVLRRALRSVLRGSDAAAARVSRRLPAAAPVLQAGPRRAHRAPAGRVTGATRERSSAGRRRSRSSARQRAVDDLGRRVARRQRAEGGASERRGIEPRRAERVADRCRRMPQQQRCLQ